MIDPDVIEQASRLMSYLERNAKACEAEGPEWMELARAQRRRIGEIRKALAKGWVHTLVDLSERDLSTGDEIPIEYHIRIPEET